MYQWSLYYQGPGNTVQDESGNTIGVLEVTEIFNIPFGSTKQAEYLLVTLKDGKKIRCWRRKSVDNNYNIMPCS